MVQGQYGTKILNNNNNQKDLINATKFQNQLIIQIFELKKKKNFEKLLTSKPINITYKWKLDYITIPTTTKDWHIFIKQFKRYKI